MKMTVREVRDLDKNLQAKLLIFNMDISAKIGACRFSRLLPVTFRDGGTYVCTDGLTERIQSTTAYVPFNPVATV